MSEQIRTGPGLGVARGASQIRGRSWDSGLGRRASYQGCRLFAGFDFVFEETSGITWFTCKKDHCGCCVSGRRRDGMEKGRGQVGGPLPWSRRGVMVIRTGVPGGDDD